MKIGIITFQWSYNCGSILQSMALKRILNEIGYDDVSVINFSTPEQRRLYSLFGKWSNAKSVAKNILSLPGRAKISDHYSQYRAYIRKQFGYTEEPFSTVEELKEKLPDFDTLIAGGDQIWNVNCEDFSTAYMLDFNDNAYKFSYSPSLGATNINKSPKANEFAELLSKFDCLSCREPNGKTSLERLTGRKVTLTLDPTLLRNADQWTKEITNNKIPFPKGQFIFYYAFSYSADNNAAVQKTAEKLSLPVVVIDAKQWYIKGLARYKNFVLSEETTPNAFLKYIEKSAFVITTSFHGTAFSIIYNKQFVYINIPKHDPKDDRTSFLVERLGLTERFITVDDLDDKILKKLIHYQEVSRKLSEMRASSLSYIEDNLKKATNKSDIRFS